MVLDLVNRSPLHDELQLRGMRTITKCFQHLFQHPQGDGGDGGDDEEDSMSVRSLLLFQKWNFEGLANEAILVVRFAMAEHPLNVQLQMWACKCASVVFRVCKVSCSTAASALSSASTSTPVPIIERLPWLTEAVKATAHLILEAFFHHRCEKSVVQWGCACLQNMAELHPIIAQSFFSHPQILSLLVNSVKAFPETPNIIKHSFMAISAIAQSTKQQDALTQLGVPALAAEASSRYKFHKGVQSALVKLESSASLELCNISAQRVQSRRLAATGINLDELELSSSDSGGDEDDSDSD